MNKLLIFLFLLPQICSGQVAPSDTVFLYFDQNSDSICTTFSTSGIELQKGTSKTFRKNIKYRNGKVCEITFHICQEEFVHVVKKHHSETLSQNAIKNIKFSTLRGAERKYDEILERLNADADKTEVLYAYPMDWVIKVFIMEKQADGKFVKYETNWIEKIE